MSIHALVSETLQLVWPARCAACDHTVPDDVVFCGPCNLSINPLDHVCPGCALPLQPNPREVMFEGKRCPRCMRVPFPFSSATGAFEYGEALSEAVVRTKHGARRHLAPRLARLMVPALAELFGRARFGASDLVVPVPLHARRLRERGFNQALELAKSALEIFVRAPALATERGLPRLERDQLRRIRDTRALGHAGPAERLAEVAGAFTVGNPARVEGRQVLLVDDVMTTGATFTECAETLLRAGATAVHVFALARAI
jgi:ComF family protein